MTATMGEYIEVAGKMLHNMASYHKQDVVVIASTREPYFSVSCGEHASDKNNLLMALVDVAAALQIDWIRDQLRDQPQEKP